MKGLIIESVPKSGTNFLASYLASATGWKFRWGRPSRSISQLLDELPAEPDPFVLERAVHLIRTESDMASQPFHEQPGVFGNRDIKAVNYSKKELEVIEAAERRKREDVIIAEHPVRSLPFFLRNPEQVPVTQPAEVMAEAHEQDYRVLFLYRDLRDIANSFAHFLNEGTRFVQFKSLDDAFEVVVHRYLPVLAQAIRVWKQDFEGLKIQYEQLHTDTRATLQKIINDLALPVDEGKLIESMQDFPTFTLRKGGTGDHQQNMSANHQQLIADSWPDLIHGP